MTLSLGYLFLECLTMCVIEITSQAALHKRRHGDEDWNGSIQL